MKFTNRIALGLIVTLLSAFPAAADRIYWTDVNAGIIQSSNLDGSDVQNLVMADQPQSVEFDPSSGRIYWSARSGGQGIIGRAESDGSSQVTLISTGADIPRSVAVDSSANRIFWTTDTGTGAKLVRSDLDGRNVAELFSVSPAQPSAVALDRVNQRVYWIINANAGHIVRRASYGGSGIIEIASVPGGGLGAPALGVAVDTLRSKVYWRVGSDCVPCSGIQRADLDGSNAESLGGGALNYLTELAIAEQAARLYWVEQFNNDGDPATRVVRAKLDATDIATIMLSQGLGLFADVSIDPGKEPVPATSWSGLAALVLAIAAAFGLLLGRRRYLPASR